MTSAVDPTMPETGNASTSSIRANFQTIKDEIDALQAGPVPTYGLLFYLKNADFASAAAQSFTPANPAPNRWRPDRMILVMRSGAYIPTIAGAVSAVDTNVTTWNIFNPVSAMPALVGNMKLANGTLSSSAYELNTTPSITMSTPNSVPLLIDLYIYGFHIPTL
jgi:hypothetical protein